MDCVAVLCILFLYLFCFCLVGLLFIKVFLPAFEPRPCVSHGVSLLRREKLYLANINLTFILKHI